MGTRQARAAQWLEHVTRWRASGLSQSAYCAREALSESAFGYWVAKANKGALRLNSTPLTLVAARAQWVEPAMREAAALRVCSPDGWQLSFVERPPAGWLRELLGGERR